MGFVCLAWTFCLIREQEGEAAGDVLLGTHRMKRMMQRRLPKDDCPKTTAIR